MSKINWKRYPKRTCLTMHECRICGDRIDYGQRYFDGGHGRRSHIHCASVEILNSNHEEVERSRKAGGLKAIMGKWPGNETDEQVQEALEEIS